MISEKAIFLHKIKYGDSGLILRVFTKSKGKMSFLIQGLKGKNKSIPAILHPLAILEIQYFDNKKSELKRIKEIQVAEPLQELRYDLHKSGLAYFLAEVNLKCLHENESQPELFNFLEASIQLLNHSQKVGNFHLIFLVRLSQFLGFSPVGSFNGREFFDIQEGLFTRLRPVHVHYLEVDLSRKLYEIVSIGYDYLEETITRQDRSKLLEALIVYYRVHIHGFEGLKSLEVLRQLNE